MSREVPYLPSGPTWHFQTQELFFRGAFGEGEKRPTKEQQ